MVDQTGFGHASDKISDGCIVREWAVADEAERDMQIQISLLKFRFTHELQSPNQEPMPKLRFQTLGRRLQNPSFQR